MPQYRRRSFSREKKSLAGLWIGLGVAGGSLLILLIAVLVSTLSNDSNSENSGGGGNQRGREVLPLYFVGLPRGSPHSNLPFLFSL